MGRNGLKYRKLKIFGIAAGLAGVLFLAGCTRKHESLEMEQQWPLKGQGLRLTGPMSLFHLPEHTA